MINNARIWWRSLAAREQRMVRWGAALSALALVLLGNVEPVWTLRARLREELPALRDQVLEMRALSKEAARLSKTLAPVRPQEVRESVERSLKAAGLQARRVESTTPGELLVTLAPAGAAAVLQWTEAAQRESRLAIRYVKFTRDPQGVLAELRFALPGAPP